MSKRPVSPLRVDPTRTATLRRTFLAAIRRGYARLKAAILVAAEKGALFGPTLNATAVFDSSDSRVKQFRGWLRTQMDSDLAGDALIQKYIDASWKKGAARSYDDVKRRGTRGRFRSSPSPLPPSSSADYLRGTRDQFLRSITGKAPTVQKVKLLASRTFSELEDVNARMATRMTRVLVDGLVQGARPRDIARRMTQEVDIEASRAEAIVRTELVRAHAEGQLDSLSDLDIKEVTAEVEWVTAGDGKVCPECSPMEGTLLSLDDARGMIPRHTNCRCAWLPHLIDDPAPLPAKVAQQTTPTGNVASPSRPPRQVTVGPSLQEDVARIAGWLTGDHEGEP